MLAKLIKQDCRASLAMTKKRTALVMSKQQGFTLIELIMAIVLLGIVATVTTSFITSTTRGTFSAAERQQVANTNHIINVQLTRALRSALPHSIRVTADKQCVEYIPVLGASRYTELRLNQAISSFKAFPLSNAISAYVAIYPLKSSNLYNLSATGAITSSSVVINNTADANGEITVSIPSHTFSVGSPTRRFYLVGQPRAVCQDGGFLYTYKNYGFITNIANLKSTLPSTEATGRSVLAAPMDVAAPIQFEYLAPSLKRNGLVRFDYGLTLNFDQAAPRYGQEVFLRNVP